MMNPNTITVRTSSEINCPAEELWARITSQAGINDEMRPVLTMTLPGPFRGHSIADVTPGTHIGKSLLLLFGVIPVGYDDITIAAIEPARMFLEESTMTGMRIWIHHRTLQPKGETTVVTDEVTLAPNALLSLIPGSPKLFHAAASAFFNHRHRRLRRATGSR